MISDMASKDNATQPTAELFSTAAVRAEQGWKKFPMRRVGAIGPIPGRAQTSASTAVPAAVLLNEQSQQQGKGLSDVTSGAGSAMGALPSLLGSLSGQNTVLTGNKSEEQLLQEQVFAARMMGAPATVASGIAATFRSNNVVSSSTNALPNWNTQPSMTSQKTLPPAQQAQAHLIATAFFNTIKPKLSQGNETPQAAPQSQQPQDLYQLQQELQAQLNNRQQKQQQYLLRPQQHEVPMRVPQQFSGSTAALNVSSKAQPQKWSNRTQSLTSNKQSDISSGELLGKLPGMLSALESNAGPQIPAIAHQREIPSDQSSNLQRQPAANLTSKYFELRGPLQKNGPAVGSLPASNLPLSMSSLATSTGSITQPQKQGLQLLEKARKPLPVELQMTQSMEVLQSLKADGYIDSPKRKKMAKGSGFEATTDIVDNNSTIWPSTLEGDWNHPKPVPEPPNYKNLKGEKTPVGRSKSKKADKVHGKKTSTPPQSSRSQNFLKGVDKATDGAPKSPWHASVDAFLQSTKRATGSDLKTSSKDRSEVQSPEVTTPVPTISPSLFSTAVATEIPFLTEVDTDETISSINRRVEMLKQQKAKILQDQMEEFYKEINITDDGAGKDGPPVTHKKTINQKVAGSRDKDKDKPRLNEHDKSRLDDRRDKDRDRHINRDKEKDKRRDDDRDRRTGTRSPPRKRPSDSKRSRSESRHQEPERKQQDHKPALSPQRSRNSSLERTKKDGASSKESSKEIEKRQGRYPSGNLHVPSADSAERRASLSPERKRKRLDEKMGEVFIDGRWQQSTLKTPPASTRGEDQPNGDKSKTKDSKVDKIKAKMGKDQDNKKREDMATPSKKTEKEEKTTPMKKTEEKNKGKNTDTATTGKGASTSKAPGNKSPVKSDSQTNTAEKADEKSAPTKPPETMKEKNDTLITAEGRKEQQDDGLSKTEGEKEKEMTESREKKMAGKVQIKSISKATELSESPAASKSTKVSESSDKGSSSAAQTSTSRVVPSINKSLPPASVNTSESSQVSGTSPSGSTGTSTAKQSTLPSEVEEINVKRSTGVSAGNGPSTVSASATATSGPAVGQNSKKRKGDKVPLTEDVPKKVSVISQDPPSTLEIKDSSIPHQMGLLEALAIEEYVQDKVMVEWFCYVCGSICHSWKVYMGHIGGRKHTTKYQRLLHADCPTLERELISKLKLLPKKGADPIAEATMGSSILGQSFALASKKNITASPLAGSGQGSFLRSEEHKKSEGIRPRCVACNLVFQKVAEYRKHLRTPAHKKKIAAQEKPTAPPVKSLQAPNEANQPLTDDSVRSTNSEGTKSPQPKSSVIGSEFITPISGFFCKLCSKFYNNEKTAREVHCATTLHITKTQQYYASRNQSMDTSFKASQGTVPSDTSVTAPAPAGNVLSNRFETAQADAGVKTSVSDYVDGGHPSCTSRPNFDQKASSVGQVFPVGGSFKPDHPDTPVMPSSDPQYVPGRAMSKTLAVAESHMESVTTEVKEEGVKPGGAMLIETTMSREAESKQAEGTPSRSGVAEGGAEKLDGTKPRDKAEPKTDERKVALPAGSDPEKGTTLMKAEQEAGKPGVTMLGKTAILPEADSKKTKINTEKPVETMSQEETKPEEAKRDLGIGGGTMIKGRTVTKEALFQVEGERDKPQGIIRESKTTPKEAVSMEPEKEVEKPDGTLPKGESASKEDVTQKSSPAAKVVRRQKLATIDPVPSQATSFEIKLHQEDSKKPDGKAEGAASQEIKATDSNLGRKETKKSILTFALPVEDCSKKVELNVSLPTEVTSLEPKASKKVEPNVSLPTEVTSLEPNAQESEVREMRFKVATLKEVPSKRASPRRTRPRKAASEEVSQESPVGTPTMTGSQDSTDIAVELKESTVDLETQADLVILSQSVSKEPPLTKRTLKEVADKEKIPAEEISPKEAPPTCFTPNKIASKETVSEAVVPKKAAPSKSLTEKLSSKDASHKETSSSKLAPNKSVSQKEVNTEEATPKELSWNNVPTKKTRLADDALVKNSAKKVACTHKKTASVETTFKSTTPILHEEVKKMPSMKATPKITSPKKGAPKDTTPKETETRRIASPGPVLKPAPSVDAAAGQNSSTTALSAPDLLDPKDPNSKTMSMDATSSPRAPRRSTQLTNVQNKTTPPRTQTKPHGSLQQKVSNKTSAKDSVLAISSQTSIITDTSTKDQDVKDRTLPGQKNTSHKISSDDAQKMVKPPPKTGSNVTSTKSTEAGLSRDTSSKSGIVREGKHVGKPKREDAKSSPAASKGKEQPQSASPASSVPAAPDSSKQVTLKVQDADPVSSLQKKSSLSGAPETATLTSSTRNPEMVKDAGCKSPRSQSACPRQRNPQELDVSADVSMDEDRGEYIDVDELMAGEVIVLDEDSEDSDQEMEMTYDDDDILVIDTVGEVSGNVSGDDEEEEDTWIMEDADGDEEAGFDMPEFGEMFAIDEVGGSDDEEEEMEDQDVHEVDWWEVLSEAEED